MKTLNNDNSVVNHLKYLNFINNNGIDTNLEQVFPVSNVITDEVLKAREELKNKLGNGLYITWFENQEKKINNYNKEKEGVINYIINRFDLENKEEIKDNQDALNMFNSWVNRSSPYVLAKNAFVEQPTVYHKSNYYSHNFYELVPIKSKYYNSNFDVIANDNDLFTFYNTITKLFKELKQYVPEKQLTALAFGGIPYIEKSLLEIYSEKGMYLGLKPSWDALVKSVQSSFDDTRKQDIDPATNKPKKEMRIPIIKNSSQEIKDYIKLKSIEYFTQYNKQPDREIINEFREDIIDIIANRSSFDLIKVAKVYTALVIAHKHKNIIEDSIKVNNLILDSYREFTPSGQRKQALESFVNLKQANEYYINNVMYGEIHDEQGRGSKIYTASEKEQLLEITQLSENLENQLQKGLIDPETYDIYKKDLEKQSNNLGKERIYSKYGDNWLKYVQIKLMGWNVLGGIGNMTFGYVANLIEASGEQYFSKKDLAKAYTMLGHSVLKNTTFNKVETDVAKKVRKGMDKLDILKDASHELYTSSTPSSFSKKYRWLRPYEVTKRTEYLNQAPLFVVMMQKTKVQTKEGEISLYDGYDNDWNWQTDKYGEEPVKDVNKVRINLDKLIYKLHGNYDNLSPTKIKQTLQGRAMMQFRGWLTEAISSRIEEYRDDPNLGEVKGRYRSVGTLYNNGKVLDSSLNLLKGILKQISFNLINLKGADFNNLVDGNKFKEIDAINMRKVCMEIAITIDTYLLLLMLGVFGGDDDDQAINILINQGTRLKTDLMMYINPMEIRNISKDIIPAMSLIKDVKNWGASAGELLIGEDEIQSGVHEGDSRFASNTAKMLPIFSKFYSTYNSASQEFKNQNN